jgi:hypothetical protein
MPSGTTAFKRNLPLDITEPHVLDLTRKFGTVVSVVFRDLDGFMRRCIVEVVFETEHQAPHRVRRRGPRDQRDRPGGHRGAVWKMQQRKLWVAAAEAADEAAAYRQRAELGQVVAVRTSRATVSVKFASRDHRNKANLSLEQQCPQAVATSRI